MLILTKIQKRTYIEDMYNKEYLYFNSLNDFRSNNKDLSGRLDPRELNTKNEQLKTLSIRIDNINEIHFHEMKKFSGQYNEYFKDPNINCCSLNWMEIEPGHTATTFHKNLINMGEKALLIYDCKKFYEILDKAIGNRGFEYSRKKVSYYNPKKFNGDLTLHHKSDEFSWQNEYRILIKPTNYKPINVALPGLKKISIIINTKDIEKLRIELIN